MYCIYACLYACVYTNTHVQILKFFHNDFWPVSHISACPAKPVFKNPLGEAKPLRWAELGPGHEETEPHLNSDNHTAQLLTGARPCPRPFTSVISSNHPYRTEEKADSEGQATPSICQGAEWTCCKMSPVPSHFKIHALRHRLIRAMETEITRPAFSEAAVSIKWVKFCSP